MRRLKYLYEVTAEIELTYAELKNAIDCAKHHHDSTCKAAADEGGFLYGWHNAFLINREVGDTRPFADDEVATWTLKTSELDLLCKILESANSIDALYKKSCDLLRQQIDEGCRANGRPVRRRD